MPVTSHLNGRSVAALLPDLSAGRGPRYTALAQALAGLILDGRIAPATRLPSERELAASLALSRATVTAAYDILRAESYLSSRSGSGSVATLPPTATLHAGAARWVAPARHGDPVASDVVDLTCATLPAPPDRLAAAVAEAAPQLADHAEGEGYEPIGLPALRQAVADRFTRRGLPTTPSQIFVTNGALHGIDLLLRLMVGPGDRVVTELPSYSGLLDAVRASGARIVPVPVAPGGGWQVPAMVAALRQSAPRLAFLIPDFHNPTGALIVEDERREVLAAARRVGTTVVVDESFVDLSMDPDQAGPVPPTAALDPSVITVGSMSKPFWGGLRCGWVRGPVELVGRLASVRAAIDMGGPILDQLVATAVFPHLDEVAAERRATLRPRRDALVAALGALLPSWRFTVPPGGLSLWIELDAPMSTPLAVAAPRHGVRVVPGSRFGVDGTLERFLRLPYTQPESTLQCAAERLAAAWADMDPAATGYAPLIVA